MTARNFYEQRMLTLPSEASRSGSACVYGLSANLAGVAKRQEATESQDSPRASGVRLAQYGAVVARDMRQMTPSVPARQSISTVAVNQAAERYVALGLLPIARGL